MNDLDLIHEKLTTLQAKHLQGKEHVKAERRRLKEARSSLQSAEAAQQIVQNVAQVVQQKAHEQIARVVSRCLKAVFDDPYEFKIRFERRRGKTEADLVFIRDGVEVHPQRGTGGGVLDVAAFALRLACMMLTQPTLRRLVIMDEPFKFVSADRRPRVKALLETLSKEMGIQFVMVTHIEELQTGTIVEVE